MNWKKFTAHKADEGVKAAAKETICAEVIVQ
jgi:hypothetical protein